MKLAHVVGNGPSWVDFKRISDDDFVIGCNVTKVSDADVTMMSDISLCNQIQHHRRHKRKPILPDLPPVIANPGVVEWLNNSVNDCHGMVLFSTYTRPEGVRSLEMSSAHFAVLWLIDNGYTDIHVWGIDSYFKNHIYSHTDNIKMSKLKKDPERVSEVANGWKDKWDEILNNNPAVKIVLHGPKDV